MTTKPPSSEAPAAHALAPRPLSPESPHWVEVLSDGTHVLPLATPGILTGTIIGLARALGETAPLLLIGMVAFVADAPSNPLQPATALPVQIYMWTNEAERAFVERTSGAIIVLLIFLAIMNITAIILRRRFERRW